MMRVCTKSNSACVQVLVFTFNHERYVRECIQSILNQEEIEVQITVFDDGSTDRTPKILQELQRDNPDQIELFLSEKNNGNLRDNYNKMSEQWRSNCKYWVVIEGDDFFGSSLRLKRQVTRMESDQNLIGVSTDCILWDVKNHKSSIISPDCEKWNYFDTVFYANQYRFYVHISSILWKNKSSGKLFPKRYLSGHEVYGEVFLTILMLRENLGNNISHIKMHGSTYRYTGEGIWSSLSQDEQLALNVNLENQLKQLKPVLLKVAEKYKLRLLEGLFRRKALTRKLQNVSNRSSRMK